MVDDRMIYILFIYNFIFKMQMRKGDGCMIYYIFIRMLQIITEVVLFTNS